MGVAIIIPDISFESMNIGQVTPTDEIKVIGLTIVDSSVTGSKSLSVKYNPVSTTQKGVTWSLVSGSEYATITSSGFVNVVSNGTIVVKAVSTFDASIYAIKTIQCIKAESQLLFSLDSIPSTSVDDDFTSAVLPFGAGVYTIFASFNGNYSDIGEDHDIVAFGTGGEDFMSLFSTEVQNCGLYYYSNQVANVFGSSASKIGLKINYKVLSYTTDGSTWVSTGITIDNYIVAKVRSQSNYNKDFILRVWQGDIDISSYF